MSKSTPNNDRRRRNKSQVANPNKKGDVNKLCPCGSGKKLKRCCKGKPQRSQAQVEEFVEHRAKAAQVIASMSKTSLTPAEIYAFSQTHKVINDINRDIVDPEIVAKWDKAIVEFDKLKDQGPNKKE